MDVGMDADEEEDVSSTARVVDRNVSVETNMDADNVGEQSQPVLPAVVPPRRGTRVRMEPDRWDPSNK